MSRTKCGYIMSFGLAFVSKTCCLKKFKASYCFGVSFSESMNKVLLEKQMDVQIKYWNETAQLVDM